MPYKVYIGGTQWLEFEPGVGREVMGHNPLRHNPLVAIKGRVTCLRCETTMDNEGFSTTDGACIHGSRVWFEEPPNGDYAAHWKGVQECPMCGPWGMGDICTKHLDELRASQEEAA